MLEDRGQWCEVIHVFLFAYEKFSCEADKNTYDTCFSTVTGLVDGNFSKLRTDH